MKKGSKLFEYYVGFTCYNGSFAMIIKKAWDLTHTKKQKNTSKKSSPDTSTVLKCGTMSNQLKL